MKKPKKIAIIGAGWNGLGCLRVLLEEGHDVTLYEQNNDVGGTWHPNNCYSDLCIHSTSRQIEFYDYPLPKHIDTSERVTSAQIFSYLQSYCREKNLYKHINFNIKLTKLNYDTQNKKFMLYLENMQNKENIIHNDYDYVVYTHGFTNKKIPKFKDASSFSGEIYHSFDVPYEKLKSFVLQDKKITIVGASKTATDFVLSLHRFGYKFKWFYRKPYWFMRFDPLRKLIQKRKAGKLDNLVYRWGVIIGFMMNDLPRLKFWLWRLLHINDTFGKKHADYKKFHFGFLDDNQIRTLKRINKDFGIQGEVKQLETNGIRLLDGRLIESDIIICCTGSGMKGIDIKLEVNHYSFSIDSVQDVYRSKIIPQIPHLFFTAYQNFSLGTINGINQGRWIAKFIEYDPSEEYIIKNSSHFDYPFFLRHNVFDSNQDLFKAGGNLLKPFFSSGELNKFDFFKWFVNEYYFNPKAPNPIEFKAPYDLRDKENKHS